MGSVQKKAGKWALWLLGTALLGAASARPVAIGGLLQSAVLETRLIGTQELMAVWTLPKLGVAVRNDPADLRLVLGGRELRYSPLRGWQAFGFSLSVPLGLPQIQGGSLLVPVEALRVLGVPVLADTPNLLDFGAPASVPAATLPPSAPVQAQAPVPAPAPAKPASTVPTPVNPAPPAELSPLPTPAAPTPPLTPVAPSAPLPAPVPTPPSAQGLATLGTVRASRTMHRTVEVRRVVLEFSDIAPYSVTRLPGGLVLTLPGVSAQPQTQTLDSGDVLGVSATASGASVQLQTGGGHAEVFTLDNPYRIVVDTTTYTDDRVPPPLDPESVPEGVAYLQRAGLHLLSFDPARFQPRVVAAPLGRAAGVAELVRGVGGVAGVNGGYFDPASNLPVDLVALGGLMTAGSLEKRATVGFTPQGQPIYGYPKPRYVLSGAFGSVTVNAVRAKADPALLTAFVGDGQTAVGAPGLTTLLVTPGTGTVRAAVTGPAVAPAGTLALTFDPARFPALPREGGAPLTVALNWQADDAHWPGAVDALSAGPLLVQGGRVALNPAREGFNTAASIWRPTRQVALCTLNGAPTIAFYEHGTPETFAAALVAAGVRDAVRLDSGSSATAYVSGGGYGNLGGYLNTVWSRPVPNAIVFVPRAAASR